MHQLVQSAIEAAKCGDKSRAQGYLKQVLTANPNDVDGWLVLAAVLDDPEKKRQCLNRALTIDPVNEFARQEMLELDRAAFRDMAAPTPVSQPRLEPVRAPVTQAPPISSTPVVQAQSGFRLDKPLVFTYPLGARILSSAIVIFLCLIATFALFISPLVGLIFAGVALIPLIVAWSFSARVEVSNEGIASSYLLYGGMKMAWDEIAEFKSSVTSQSLDLISKGGRELSITGQVSGYSQIVEILCRMRPDLFSGQLVSPDGVVLPKVAFSGEKVFKRNGTGSMIAYGIGAIALLFGLWGFFSNWGKSSGWLTGGFFIIFGLLLIGNNLLAVQELIIRPQQITIIKNFGEEQLTQSQISEIKIKTVRRRRGRVSHFVVIQCASGGSISLSGLGGAELIYGTLMNWWQGAN